MKHRIGFNRLERRQGHRKALKNNMVTSLFRYERVETTKAKALEIRRVAEKMVTRARTDSVHNRRIIAQRIHDNEVLAKLFTEIAPRYVERPGGYTRILKTGRRQGDAAETVILELVDRVVEEKAKRRPEKERETPAEREVPKVEEKEAPARTAKSRKRAPAPVIEESETESKESTATTESSVEEPEEGTDAPLASTSEPSAAESAKRPAPAPKLAPAEEAETAGETGEDDSNTPVAEQERTDGESDSDK